MKRAKHETFWVRPEWGSGRVPSFGGLRTTPSPSEPKRQDNQNSLSKSMTLTERRPAFLGTRGRRRWREPSGQVDFRPERERVAAEPAAGKRARLLLDRIKREKGVWWMPWQQEAMKDVALCDKPGGGESTLRSRDLRMGQPT